MKINNLFTILTAFSLTAVFYLYAYRPDMGDFLSP